VEDLGIVAFVVVAVISAFLYAMERGFAATRAERRAWLARHPPLRRFAEAKEGAHVRVQGRVSAIGQTLAGPSSGRACVRRAPEA
jgi:hypothetical protein